VGQDFLIIVASQSHPDVPVTRIPLDEWSARRRDFWQHITLTRDIPPRDSNPQPQEASGRRPMRALGWARKEIVNCICFARWVWW
jgi:hypothetical protein